MKKLNIAAFKDAQLPKLAELKISGGISCEEAEAVMDYLYEHNYDQWVANVDLYYHGDFQCD